ncbi:uncharacterized protein TRAVEDRAFT_52413 [Trametes versicolor FP-101664 SS1]|uniref:uncharacterized protein n=1 Tax=Trametes versicolor (strain FP-101664) TaxID=717944 RepID=UPI000462141A|nr:uncharacterized protein TRAVEDRAFT_52413 [Trametes versicolor FP-101664 SS1]EIW53286.1 hypothetical protein TRAVEDRAFT_52413 [Trametes versicolor FP-101664 SS1]
MRVHFSLLLALFAGLVAATPVDSADLVVARGKPGGGNGAEYKRSGPNGVNVAEYKRAESLERV